MNAAGRRARVAAAVAAALVAVGCTGPLQLDVPSGATSLPWAPTRTTLPGSEPVPGSAGTALAVLPVKGRAPKTGYSRAAFGPSWADVDRDGCDQRNQVLARDLDAETLRPGGCVVLTGLLRDPYTGRDIAFRRGRETSDEVQIDHVVALSAAWQTGAQALDEPTRAQLAGDPLNLQATDGPTNQSKGDGDAASWLPPVRAYRCSYVTRQVAVKTRYRLWVTPAEHDAIAAVLAGCPGQPLSDGGGR